MIRLVGLFLILFGNTVFGQSIKTFEAQKAIKLEIGDTLIIFKKAVALDSVEFEKIRANLTNYKELSESYDLYANNNNQLISNLKLTQQKLSKITDNTKINEADLVAIKSIVADINSLSNDFGSVNTKLEHNNKNFTQYINELETNNAALNNEINKLKIKNLKNYLISGLIGVAVGATIISIL
jgi:DNA repair ATPase RecN